MTLSYELAKQKIKDWFSFERYYPKVFTVTDKVYMTTWTTL